MAMHGFSRYSGSGGGGGAGPVNYFTADSYYDDSENAWKARDPLPEIIEGNPQLMIEMIDALDHKHKYTSGVLSFTHSDTEKLKLSGLSEAILDISGRLKEMLFAGISPEHQHILIVKQSHLSRLELHYVLPRHNYEVDRAWNPAPPGKAKYQHMDALVDFINVKYGLDDPRDPLRARVVKDLVWESFDKKDLRELLNDFFKKSVIDGAVNSRGQLINLARNSGIEITRVGDTYVSMRVPGSEKAIRLKGEIYDKKFTSRDELADTKTKIAERQAYLTKSAVAQRYKQSIRERQSFVEKRFKKILDTVRAGEDYQETQRFNAAKRGDILEISQGGDCGFSGKYRAQFLNANNTNGLGNEYDGFGDEIAKTIARAERVVHNNKQSLDQTGRVLAAGDWLAKSTFERIRDSSIIVQVPSGIPPTPYSMLSDSAADVSGVAGQIDSGDPEADRIINGKRNEAAALEQARAIQNNKNAMRNEYAAKKLADTWVALGGRT